MSARLFTSSYDACLLQLHASCAVNTCCCKAYFLEYHRQNAAGPDSFAVTPQNCNALAVNGL